MLKNIFTEFILLIQNVAPIAISILAPLEKLIEPNFPSLIAEWGQLPNIFLPISIY